MLGWYVKV